ncbi:trk system potassium uptake protein [Candidatus Hakubella thermalkaliphila]|nr:trk system potassium uptake protein [Candidatus Hakubella thermalkaliphila]
MYVVVVGCGRVGSQLATLLASEGHDVAVVDESTDSFKRLGATFNGLVVQGMGYDEDILRQAGIEQADALAAVTNYDNANLVTADVATRIFNVPKVVVRLDNPEHEKSYQKMGVDYVCGTKMVATAILNHLHKGTFRHHVAFPSAVIAVVEFRVG